MAIDATEEQGAKLLALDQSQPVMFINWHRYYDRARYAADYADPDYPTDVSGREAYHRYLQQVEARFMPQVGARLVIAGSVGASVIGPGEWDEVVIGEYPSIAHANRMSGLPGYADIAIHRLAGLAEAQTVAVLEHDMQRLAIADALINRD